MVVKIHIYLFLVMAYMYTIGKIELFIYAYIFILLHEIGHVLVAFLLKVKICEVELLPIGVNAKYNQKFSKSKELVISLAGPIASFCLYKFLKIKYLKDINLFIAITNLIPLKPYDGGRIINSLISISFGEKIAEKVTLIMQKIFLNLLVFVAIFLIIKYKNYYFAIACIYMICIVKDELKNEKFNALIKYLQIE